MKCCTMVLLLSVLIGSLTGCDSKEEAKSNVVVEKRAKIFVADLPPQFLAALDTTSEQTIDEKLRSLDSLTLDATTLTIADVGANRSVTLAANIIKLINGARIVTNGNQFSLAARTMEFNNSGGIDSFGDESTKPAASANGADGGRVDIYSTKSVYGTLRVSLPGQAGGEGATGGVGRPGKTGDRGSDGSDKLAGCGSGGGNGGRGQDGFTGENGTDGGQGVTEAI